MTDQAFITALETKEGYDMFKDIIEFVRKNVSDNGIKVTDLCRVVFLVPLERQCGVIYSTMKSSGANPNSIAIMIKSIVDQSCVSCQDFK